MAKRIIILGAGGWGTALAVVAANRGHAVTLWARRPEAAEEIRRSRENRTYLAGVRIPDSVEAAGGALPQGDAVVCAIPTQHIRATLTKTSVGDRPLLSVSKGIEMGTIMRPSEILREIYPRASVTVLSGPSHAEEVGRGLPTVVVAAARHEEHATLWQELFSGGAFRVYTSNDPTGVELGGALKNVIAIGAGLSDGLKLGDNAKAALITRGIVEMSRLGRALGARKHTFFGISGIGDLVTTCTSAHGRNLYVGRQVGAGRTLADVLGEMRMVAEGVWTSKAIVKLAAKVGVDMPISQEVHAILHEGKPPMEALKTLLARAPRSEEGDLA
ncbi:MAG: NAD(P)-dependent glycerol-3-phosphate dehydrogenase [Planctomycetes bacterium]|nr:NAD(P)-dependent glycerol-3-phosphate dehydrogenase [Planctomycetota bacterium]